jgi:hypothetical protein
MPPGIAKCPTWNYWASGISLFMMVMKILKKLLPSFLPFLSLWAYSSTMCR